MRIQIVVKPNSKVIGVHKESDGSFTVRVNAPPVDGKANAAVIEALSEHFSVRKSAVKILHGETGKRKLVEISGL